MLEKKPKISQKNGTYEYSIQHQHASLSA